MAKFISKILNPFEVGKVRWGAEICEDEIRLACIRTQDNGSFEVQHQFKGDPIAAEKFALEHHLKYKGLHLASSALPYKMMPMTGLGSENEEDFLQEEVRQRPKGLEEENVSVQTLTAKPQPLLLQVREDMTQNYLKGLPQHLSTVRYLTASPLAYHQFYSPHLKHKNVAALILEKDYTHALLYYGSELQGAWKFFMGYEQIEDSPEMYEKELVKILSYHLQTKWMGSAIEGIVIFKDGPNNEASTELTSLPYHIIPLILSESLKKIPHEYYGAIGASMMEGVQSTEDGPSLVVSLGSQNDNLFQEREKWFNYSNRMVQLLMFLFLFGGLTLVSLYGGAFGFEKYLAEDKSKSAKDMLQLSQLKGQQSQVMDEIKRLQDVLIHRSRVTEELQRVASALPDKVWLTEWKLDKLEGKSFNHTISGYCYNAAQVSDFMSRLEQQKVFKSVKLKSTESIPGSRIHKKTRLRANRQDLIYFVVGVEQ